jgi:hypothetical protein
MTTYGGVKVKLRVFSTLILHGRELLASRLDRFAPGERVLGTHWMPGWMSVPNLVWTLWRGKKQLSFPRIET